MEGVVGNSADPDRDDSLIFSLLTANVGAYDEQGRRGLFKKHPAEKPKSIKLPDGPSQSRRLRVSIDWLLTGEGEKS